MNETRKPSTRLPAHTYYAIIADKMDRDPVQDPDANGRATVPMGRGFGMWQRCNPGAQLVWVDDAEGRPRALTPKQALVISFGLSMVDGSMLTMRAMAAKLGVNVSTVSRALAKAQAWGILVYTVGRGRFAGLVIVRYVRDSGYLDAMRKAAKERVRRWSQAAERRISRLALNVASYIQEGRDDYDGYYHWSRTVTRTTDATLTAQPFTVQELRDVGII